MAIYLEYGLNCFTMSANVNSLSKKCKDAIHLHAFITAGLIGMCCKKEQMRSDQPCLKQCRSRPLLTILWINTIFVIFWLQNFKWLLIAFDNQLNALNLNLLVAK